MLSLSVSLLDPGDILMGIRMVVRDTEKVSRRCGEFDIFTFREIMSDEASRKKLLLVNNSGYFLAGKVNLVLMTTREEIHSRENLVNHRTKSSGQKKLRNVNKSPENPCLMVLCQPKQSAALVQ
jgi:hypothetical protein